MRLTYIPEDGFLKIDGKEVFVDNPADCPAGLHAIQVYTDGEIEVEWVDTEKRRCLGNSCGCSGLPGGDAFLVTLTDLHAAAVEEELNSELTEQD